MRPKLLKIEGLQSFRDCQEIDFTVLGETGLFGIFGPTGSGKSTVLDAITFALYGKVKRAERGTQGIINTNQDTAKVAFSFQLFKDGSRRTYRVERNYQRKKGSENSCEAKIARLIEVTAVGEIPLCDKATEVTSSIEALLGLSHDDFTRAVVLPQNSFQEFLFLDNRKKREMLERIFYLEEYGRELNDKLFRKMDGLKSRIEGLSGELRAYDDASDQALAEADQLATAALLLRQTLESELLTVNSQFAEAGEVWQLVQELREMKKQRDGLLSLRDSREAGRIQLDRGRRADDLREMIDKNKAQSEKLAVTISALEQVATQLPVAAASLKEMRQQLESQQAAEAAAVPQLLAQRTRLVDGLPLQADISRMDGRLADIGRSASQLEEKILGITGQITIEKQNLAQLDQKYDQFKGELAALQIDPDYRNQIQAGLKLEEESRVLAEKGGELNKKTAALQQVIIQQEEELAVKSSHTARFAAQLQTCQDQLGRKALNKPGDRQLVLAAQEALYRFQADATILHQKNREIIALVGKLDGLTKQNQAEQKEWALLAAAEKQAGADLAEESAMLDAAVQEMAAQSTYLLAKDLREGEACPVCGSPHHPFPADRLGGEDNWAEREEQLAGAEKRLKAAERSLKAAEASCLVKSEQIKSSAEQMRQAQEETSLKTEEYRSRLSSLPADLQGSTLPEIDAAISLRIQQQQDSLQAADDWENENRRLEKEISQINLQLADEKMAEQGILSGLQVNRANKAVLEEELAGARLLYKQCQDQYKHFLLDKKITSAAGELNRLNESDRRITLLQKRLAEVEEQIARKRLRQEAAQAEIGHLSGEQVKLTAEAAHLGRERNEQAEKLRILAGDSDIAARIKGIDQQLETFTALSQQLQEKLSSQEKNHQELLTANTTLNRQKEIYADDLNRDEQSLQKAMLARGFADVREVAAALISQELQQTLAEEIQRYDQDVSRLKNQQEMVSAKLGERSIEEGAWRQLQSEQQKKSAAKEAAVSQSEVARSNQRMIKVKHEKWQGLQAHFLALSQEQDYLVQIQTLLKGERGKDNSFIDYIAEERLRYVAAKASETLGLMTRFKYALELDADAGFIIRDNGNGGVHRMVSSLSGGETFLTSLALALALSEQIQLKGQSPLEFFFLDEGFGTLDSTLLDTVIDALERLSSQERVIGIISHVPEMKSRISRRLIIEGPSLQGVGSRVRIEKA